MSLFNDASLITTPNGVKAGKLFSVKPFEGSGDFTWVRNTSATRVNENGLIETVGANVPRLDYSNGGCPNILVEPQRTNLLLRSEEFENSYWLKSNTIVTANTTIAPNGTLTADTMSVISNASRVISTSTVTSGTYTISAYVKVLSGSGTMRFNIVLDGAGQSSFFTPTSEWQRFEFTFTAVTAASAFAIRGGTFVGDVAIWGAQLEAGSNATSYIPTVASAVTRNADVGTLNTTGLGLTEITETFETGAPNVITTIPTTYQLPNGRIKTIVGL